VGVSGANHQLPIQVHSQAGLAILAALIAEIFGDHVHQENSGWIVQSEFKLGACRARVDWFNLNFLNAIHTDLTSTNLTQFSLLTAEM